MFGLCGFFGLVALIGLLCVSNSLDPLVPLVTSCKKALLGVSGRLQYVGLVCLGCLVRLVILLCLASLVCLVILECLVCWVCFVRLVCWTLID